MKSIRRTLGVTAAFAAITVGGAIAATAAQAAETPNNAQPQTTAINAEPAGCVIGLNCGQVPPRIVKERQRQQQRERQRLQQQQQQAGPAANITPVNGTPHIRLVNCISGLKPC